MGDEVLTLDPVSGLPQFSEVLLFLDRKPSERRTFVQISTFSGRQITVTPSHLLLIMQEDGEVRPMFAGQVRRGTRLLVLPPGADAVVWDQVTHVDVRLETGVFAPLTSTGTIIVDEVAASCYAVVKSHLLAHVSFSPVRLFSNLRHSVLALWRGVRFLETHQTAATVAPSEGVHWYAKILYAFARVALPAHWLYND